MVSLITKVRVGHDILRKYKVPFQHVWSTKYRPTDRVERRIPERWFGPSPYLEDWQVS